jgi:hypothetical protein
MMTQKITPSHKKEDFTAKDAMVFFATALSIMTSVWLFVYFFIIQKK